MADLLQLFNQSPVLVHLEDYVCPAHQLPIDVELGKCGPVAVMERVGGV